MFKKVVEMSQISISMRRLESWASSTKPVIQVLIAAFCLGALYGLIFKPMWMEVTELAQVVANTVRYDANNPWYYEINGSLTLLTSIPAIFIKLGASSWFLSLMSSALMSAIAFSSIAILAYIFSHNRLFSIVMPFLLLNYTFGNAHYYPVVFPISFWSFGQIGLFLAVLCLSLLALAMWRSAGFLIGVLPALHPGWAIIVWATTASYLVFFRKKISIKAFMMFFLAGAFLFVVAYFSQRHILPPQHATVTAAVDQHQQFLDGSRLRLVWSQRDENGNPASHNLLIHEASKPFIESIKFFSSEIIVLISAFLGLSLFRKKLPEPALIYLKLSIIFTLIVCVLKFAEEVGPHFFWLASVSESLPFYLQRVIVGRWLNLDTLSAPIIFLGSLSFLAFSKKSILAFLSLTIFTFLILRNPAWTLNPILPDSSLNFSWASLIIVVTLALYLINKRYFAFGILDGIMAKSPFIFLACLIGITAGPLAKSIDQVLLNKLFLGSDKFDEISGIASAHPGLLVLAPGVRGIQDYNPQLRTNRPIAMASPIFVRGASADIANTHRFNEKIYCLDIYAWDAPFHFTEKIKSCFEGRSASDWKLIEQEFGATSVLVPSTWVLKLPLLNSSAGLSLYDIGSVQ